MSSLDHYESLNPNGSRVSPFQATEDKIRKGSPFVNGKEGELLKIKHKNPPVSQESCWLRHQRVGRVIVSSREPTANQTSKTIGQPQRGFKLNSRMRRKLKISQGILHPKCTGSRDINWCSLKGRYRSLGGDE